MVRLHVRFIAQLVREDLKTGQTFLNNQLGCMLKHVVFQTLLAKKRFRAQPALPAVKIGVVAFLGGQCWGTFLFPGLAIKNPPKKNLKNPLKKPTKNDFLDFFKFLIFYENNTNFSL